jgi:hypothetical protein
MKGAAVAVVCCWHLLLLTKVEGGQHGREAGGYCSSVLMVPAAASNKMHNPITLCTPSLLLSS